MISFEYGRFSELFHFLKDQNKHSLSQFQDYDITRGSNAHKHHFLSHYVT